VAAAVDRVALVLMQSHPDQLMAAQVVSVFQIRTVVLQLFTAVAAVVVREALQLELQDLVDPVAEETVEK
jgi:hypothetical protein